MAQIVKRTNKAGEVSYLIRVSDGYGVDGRQRKKSMTWTPPAGMTPKKLEKELQRQALIFEESVDAGTSQDGSIRFQEFSKKWFTEFAKKQLKVKTYEEYEKRLVTINQAIGHIKLRELKTGHLNAFYSNLQEEGMRGDTKYKARGDITAAIKAHSKTLTAFSTQSGISIATVKQAALHKNINPESASAIATALGAKRSDLFTEQHAHGTTLASNTVRSYHRIISSCLGKAVKWGYIPFNPATNAELPKMETKEAAHLDEADARRLLATLHKEPVKYRAMITFDLLSGLRRGELLGLRWQDVDFTNETITIVQALSYSANRGLFFDTPKNKTSSRPLKLSRSAFIMLREYQEWQNDQREKCGDYWKNEAGLVFTADDGSPVHPDTLSKWFREYVRRHNFPDVHVHSLRHTYASLMIADGTPLVVVSKRLGHAQVSTTANIYSHVIASADEKAALVTEKFADVIIGTGEEPAKDIKRLA